MRGPHNPLQTPRSHTPEPGMPGSQEVRGSDPLGPMKPPRSQAGRVSTEPEVLQAAFMRPELPLHLEVQVLAFARLIWGHDFTGGERYRDRMHDEPEAIH